MSCFRCGGEMEERRVSYCACSATPAFMVENVPARVCEDCGTKTYSTGVVTLIEQISDGQISARRATQMHVYDYDEVARATAPPTTSRATPPPRQQVLAPEHGTQTATRLPSGVSTGNGHLLVTTPVSAALPFQGLTATA
jgi:YgiT-type zinc finger domain-containing protein